MIAGDSISFYTEQELKDFLAEYDKPENCERYVLPGIPPYYEIRRELLRIDRIKGALEQ